MTKDNEVSESSGNVFADLGLKDAPELFLKAELTRQICNRLKELELSQTEAASRLGLAQPDVSKLANGRYSGFSADRLIGILSALDMDVDIVIRPSIASSSKGTVRVVQEAH